MTSQNKANEMNIVEFLFIGFCALVGPRLLGLVDQDTGLLVAIVYGAAAGGLGGILGGIFSALFTSPKVESSRRQPRQHGE